MVTTLMKERLSKGLLHEVSTIPTVMTILTKSILILRMSFGLPFQETKTLGISLWVDLKALTQWE
jgi:hypothetical protein